MTNTISRDRLRAIIERAIPTLYESTSEAARIRAVAETAETIAYGDWQIGEVCCPATQADLKSTVIGIRFAQNFDLVMRVELRVSHLAKGTVTVIESA